ncbi:MAG: glycosyltransferase family 2 protein [Pseudomonadota bacterium]|jgi:glycosyltransferase involved in cell wall biosynthesis
MIPTKDPDAALEFCRALSAHVSRIEEQQRTPIELSVVLPVHNEASNLPLLFQRLVDTLKSLVDSFELIFVDDGSTDGSIEEILKLADQHPFVVAVILSRNFGHQAAVVAGLDHARGLAVVVMDSDLQDEPEIIPSLYAQWREGNDVVYAVRKTRIESRFRRIGYSMFYRLLKKIARVDIPLDAGDFSLLDRKVLDAMHEIQERNPFVRGMRAWVGFKQAGVPVDRKARHSGESKYNIASLFALAVDGLVGFSFFPLRCIAWAGGVLSLASILLGLFYFMKKISVGLNPPGFATLTVLTLFLAGVQLLTLGVMSEYLGRVLDEVKGRPRYIVGRRINWAPRAYSSTQQ